MTGAVVALAVVIAVMAGALAVLARSRRRALTAASRAAADREARVHQAETDRSAAVAAGIEAEHRAAEAEARAAVAEHRTAEAHALVGRMELADGRLASLWSLARLAVSAERARAEALSTAARPPAVQGLEEVLAAEVERIRDEAGVPGDAHVAVDPPADPAEAVVILAAARAVLGSLIRHSQGYELDVRREVGQVELTVVCDGFDGPDDVADETIAILAALSPAGGQVDLDRDAAGRLRARVGLTGSTGEPPPARSD